jgi:N-methylhydantoinase B
VVTTNTVGIDPVTFEVLNNAFSSLVDEMGALVQNCALSMVVSEARDYSGSICNATGDLVATGSNDQPAHIGTIPYTVKGMLDWIGKPASEYFREGDIVIVNDAYIGGTHNQDVRLIMPVFIEGEILAYVQSSAHWTDIGGHVPGSFDPNARSSHGEGLILPPIRIVRGGELDKDLLRVVLRNIRTPELAQGDLLAQIGAARLGAKRFRELTSTYGTDLILTEMESLTRYSEALLREEFSRLPDGGWEFSVPIDRDPGSESDDPVVLRMRLSIEGDRVQYDFSESDKQAKGAINATRSSTFSSAIVATKAIFPKVPLNQGFFNAIDFVLPDGLVCSATYPAPISGMAAGTFPGIIDCVLGTFIQVAPERCMAGPVGLINTTWGGDDPRPGYGQEFVAYIWLEGGFGARPGKKDNHTSMCLFSTAARNVPIEQQERVFPLMYDAYRLETDSFGAGFHRGGAGVTRILRFTHSDAVLSVIGDGERFGPWGWAGGKDAPGSRLIYAPGTKDERSLGMFCTGETISQDTPVLLFESGGGGWGEPLERPVEWVLEDVENEILSMDKALEDYGVVLKRSSEAEYEVDKEATVATRAARRREGHE